MLQNQTFIKEAVQDTCDAGCELGLLIDNDVAFVDFQCEQKVKLQLKQGFKLIPFSVAPLKMSVWHIFGVDFNNSSP